MTFKAFLILIGLITAASYAQTLTLEQAVANSIDGLLSDTVNEGDRTAYVKEVRKKPVMNCTVAPKKNDPSTQIAKCDVTFTVKMEYVDDKCESSCFLIYKIKNKDLNSIEGNEDLENKCIEDLGSVEC